MHIAVLGAGVTGATTAYFLAEAGHDVTIIDRSDEVAAATSHANGGQLSYSYTDSLARPEFIPKIPSLLLGADPAIRIGILRNLYLSRWGIHFLAQCTNRRARENTVAVLEIALRSAKLIDELQNRLGLDFAYRTAGKLVVLPHESDVPGARERAELKRGYGCDTDIIGFDEAVTLEPALEAMQQSFAAAIYSADDQVGDARAFSCALIDWLVANRSADLRLGHDVRAILAPDGRVASIDTDRARIEVDAAVVCLGPWSARVLRPLGIDPRIYPVRGYSVTLPPGPFAPSVSVTNLEHRIVFSLLEDRVRIAGFADFLGYATRRDDQRRARMVDIAKRIAPEAADYDAEQTYPWGGFRPVTPTSRPVVGPTRVGGLFLNTGHGVLGWTLACATAQDVAQSIAEHSA